MRAGAAVGIAGRQVIGKQASSGIGNAHGTVNEGLDFAVLRNMLPDIFLVKNIRTAAVLCLCTCCVISLTNDNRYLMFTDRDAMPQYKFMRDIEKSGISNPTLLNYKFMDAGFYTTTGIVPDIKYFTSLNSLYQSIEECQNYWADNGLTDFIVMQSDNVYEFDKYVLMDSAVFWSEGADRTYWLYRRIY